MSGQQVLDPKREQCLGAMKTIMKQIVPTILNNWRRDGRRFVTSN